MNIKEKLETLGKERVEIVGKLQEIQHIAQQLTTRIIEIDGATKVLSSLIEDEEGENIDTENNSVKGTDTDKG